MSDEVRSLTGLSDSWKTPSSPPRSFAAMADLNQAREFMAANARLLDRRRFESLAGDGDPEATLAVLGGYQRRRGIRLGAPP